MKTAIALLAFSAVASASAFECPSAYTLTSTDCSSFCKNAEIPSDGCIYYPAKGEFPCADTSIGYCAQTSSAACSVKCLATSFAVDGALSIGLRGATGSFGRSEPIEAIQDLALRSVTKLSIKDFLLSSGSPATHKMELLASSDNASKIQTLELINVNVNFATGALPSTLTKLVLNNNALSMTPTSSLRQDSNATTPFPVEIFSMTSLQELDLTGNPALQKESFSSDQLAFFNHLKSFKADFTL